MKKSWKTTLAGVLVFLGVLAAQAGHALDSDPTTVFSMEAVVTALGVLFMGIFARDKNVTSEQEGAK